MGIVTNKHVGIHKELNTSRLQSSTYQEAHL